ncbi:MAG: MoaD/ThiS family protein [Eubacteriales bacterium]|nr:MoaD/ThiS family protein [Eubacteriales bacterium]
MIEVRLFATLRKDRGKILYLSSADFHTGSEILAHLRISEEDVAIFLINGFHSKPDTEVKAGGCPCCFSSGGRRLI